MDNEVKLEEIKPVDKDLEELISMVLKAGKISGTSTAFEVVLEVMKLVEQLCLHS